MLAAREKCRALLHQSFQRLGGKKLQEHVLLVPVSNRQSILAKFGKLNLIEMRVAFGAERLDRGLLRKLGFDSVNRLLCPQREAGEEIVRHGHAGHDVHINEALVNEQLTDGIVIIRPVKLEAVGGGVTRLAFGREL